MQTQRGSVESERLNLLLATIGSLGDVHPFAALGLALKRRGHRVRLVTTGNYESFARGLGLEFVELASAEMHWEKTLDPNARTRSRRYVAECIRPLYEIISELRTQGDTVVIGSNRMFGARVAQEKLGVPFVSVDLQPAAIRSVYESPGLPLWDPPKFLGPLGRAWRTMQFRIIDRLYSTPILEPALNALRAELGLSDIHRPLQTWVHSPELGIGLFPEWFAEQQPDWPRSLRLTGFPLFDEGAAGEMPPDLDEFLDEGAPPIVFTFGTEYRFAHRLLRESATACARGGFRGILLTRHADQVPADLPEGVVHFRYVPLTLLLPRCAAIVHAGGIGTTAVALASGTPQLIVPHAHDQPDNAARLRRMGVASVLSERSYDAASVASALGALMSSQDAMRSCSLYRERMAGEHPLPRTCELIEGVMSSRRAGYRAPGPL